MSIETTHICDRCGVRHVGDRLPMTWKANVHIQIDATDLPTYSPWAVDERRETLCTDCISAVADAIRAALSPPNHNKEAVP